MAKLLIPTPLRKFTDNQSTLETSGETVKDAIRSLTELFPEVKKHLLEADGNIRSFVRIYVGDHDIKALDNENTTLDSESIVSIIPAIAGGTED
ncbi:MAG: MoaD/ThiS family protein [Bacteroidota bacterium]